MKPLAGGAIDDAKLAIKYILSKDYIDVVIPGMENVKQVRENVSVIKDINITKEDEAKILEGYYTMYNLEGWAKQRYKSLEVKAGECIECGLCETKCPYELPIREMLKQVSAKLD